MPPHEVSASIVEGEVQLYSALELACWRYLREPLASKSRVWVSLG